MTKLWVCVSEILVITRKKMIFLIETNKETNKKFKFNSFLWKNYQKLQIMFCFRFVNINSEILFRVSMRKGDQGLLSLAQIWS